MLKKVDLRERNGFTRTLVPCRIFRNDPKRQKTAEEVFAIVYHALPSQADYWGPRSIQDTAQVILNARGCSGTNEEYFRRTLKAIRELGGVDAHLLQLEEELDRLATLNSTTSTIFAKADAPTLLVGD